MSKRAQMPAGARAFARPIVAMTGLATAAGKPAQGQATARPMARTAPDTA